MVCCRECEVFSKARLVIMDSLKLASESDAAMVVSFVYHVWKNYLDDPSYSIVIHGCVIFILSGDEYSREWRISENSSIVYWFH